MSDSIANAFLAGFNAVIVPNEVWEIFRKNPYAQYLVFNKATRSVELLTDRLEVSEKYITTFGELSQIYAIYKKEPFSDNICFVP